MLESVRPLAGNCGLIEFFRVWALPQRPPGKANMPLESHAGSG